MTLFRAVIHLHWSALLSATSRLAPSDMLSRMAFLLTHTSFEAGRANSLQRHRSMWWPGIYTSVKVDNIGMLLVHSIQYNDRHTMQCLFSDMYSDNR